jgi:hypothetical protein
MGMCLISKWSQYKGEFKFQTFKSKNGIVNAATAFWRGLWRVFLSRMKLASVWYQNDRNRKANSNLNSGQITASSMRQRHWRGLWRVFLLWIKWACVWYQNDRNRKTNSNFKLSGQKNGIVNVATALTKLMTGFPSTNEIGKCLVSKWSQ